MHILIIVGHERAYAPDALVVKSVSSPDEEPTSVPPHEHESGEPKVSHIS